MSPLPLLADIWRRARPETRRSTEPPGVELRSVVDPGTGRRRPREYAASHNARAQYAESWTYLGI